MWSLGAARRSAAVAALLLLTGCATTVEGAPTAGDGGSTAGTSRATGTSAEPTSSGSDPGTAGFDCEGEGVIAPEDQPFCFVLPDGFRQDDVSLDAEAGSAASYTTGILIADRDVIAFSVYELSLDSDDLSNAELTDALEVVIDDLAAQGFDFDTTEPELSVVDGARTFRYSGMDSRGLHTDNYFIVRNSTELQVNCQWETMEQELLAGCGEVLSSLQISG